MTAAGAFLGWTCALGGVGLLWRAWRRGGGGATLLAGWAALAVGALGWRLAGDAPDKALALALLAPSLVAALILALQAMSSVRARRPAARRREADIEPPASGGAPWRAWAQAACVGPLAGVASLGAAVLLMLRAPWPPADRLVAAGFALPIAWAAAAAWATTDRRLGRVAGALALTAGASFGLALL